MKNAIKFVYAYLGWKPEIGILSAASSYIIAMKTIMLTDDYLKLIATVSAIAACIVSCLTAISWIIKSIVWSIKMYKTCCEKLAAYRSLKKSK